MQSEFLLDMRLVRFDRFHTQMQLGCEAGRAKTAPDQRKDLELAVSKRIHLGSCRLDVVARETIQKATRHACARMPMTIGDPVKRL